jgi:hypothetical protein
LDQQMTPPTLVAYFEPALVNLLHRLSAGPRAEHAAFSLIGFIAVPICAPV